MPTSATNSESPNPGRHAAGGQGPAGEATNFDRAPFTIAWELTRACAYSCAHCRAEATPRRDPLELSTSEALSVVDDLAGFGNRPILVLTGGDPLMRKDIFEIAAHASEQGLRVALTPTATGLATPTRMREAHAAGIRLVAFSIDAPDASLHDVFRGVPGSFRRTLRGIEAAAEAGLSLQVNTTACAQSKHAIRDMPPLVDMLGAVRWAVFFLVPVGRGRSLRMLSAVEHERLLRWLDEESPGLPFDVKATAAPQHRRIALQREARAGASVDGAAGSAAPALPGPDEATASAAERSPGAAERSSGPPSGSLSRPRGTVNDGRGFMFISHRGEVMPSGFLPLAAGNVRKQSAVRMYRESALFRSLRDPEQLSGKCGRCEYRAVCGGSRARAYACSGDPLAEDPGCPYDPAPAGPGAAPLGA